MIVHINCIAKYTFLLLLLEFTACGRRDIKTNRKVIDEYIFNDPLSYTLYDKVGCREAEIDKTYTYSLRNKVIKHKLVDNFFYKTVDGSVTNEAIKSISYAEEYVRSCKNIQNPRSCSSKWYFKKAGKKLAICNNGYKYPRDSYEGIALSVANFVTKQYKKITSYTDLNVDPVDLKIGVVLKSRAEVSQTKNKIKLVSKVSTHNAAYHPTRRAIFIYPEDKNSVLKNSGSLWESEFVVAHEYGHHIQTLVGKESLCAHYNLKWDFYSENFIDNFKESESNKMISRLCGSFNEAFADLNAHYSLLGDISSLQNLALIGTNRRVELNSFANGDLKIFTSSNFYSLLTQNSATLKCQECQQNNYSDIHISGAIIASTVNNLFKMLVNYQDRDLSKEQKYKQLYLLSHMWLKEVKKLINNLKSEKNNYYKLAVILPQSMLRVFNLFINSDNLNLTTSTNTIKDNVCSLIDKSLPILKEQGVFFDNNCN